MAIVFQLLAAHLFVTDRHHETPCGRPSS
jgi:hypothetical protein